MFSRPHLTDNAEMPRTPRKIFRKLDRKQQVLPQTPMVANVSRDLASRLSAN